MSDQNTNELRNEYDECISKVNNLANMIKQLSSEHELENLEEVVIEEDFLNLLANSLYAVNSLTYAYSNLKGLQFPPEFVILSSRRPKSRSIITRLKTHSRPRASSKSHHQHQLQSINKLRRGSSNDPPSDTNFVATPSLFIICIFARSIDWKWIVLINITLFSDEWEILINRYL